MKDLKKISDEIMKDITVSQKLKARTLERCKRNSFKPVIGILVPAACVVLIVAAVNTMGWFSPNREQVRESTSKATLMMESSQAENLPLDNASSQLKAAEASQMYDFDTTEKAKEAFGDKMLLPGYIPEGFKLSSITGWGRAQQNIDRIAISYSSDTGTFQITEGKVEPANTYEGFKKVDINGVSGYLRTEDTKDPNIQKQNTRLYWFNNETQYSVIGQVKEDIAIKVAQSMK